MKQQSQSDSITKADLQLVLSKSLSGLRELKNEMFDQVRGEQKAYRDENMTRLDDVMGELHAIREDNTIGTYQIRELRETTEDHEKRIVNLEKS